MEEQTVMRKVFGHGQTEVLGSSPIGAIGDQATTAVKIACSMTTTTKNGGIGNASKHTSFCAARRGAQVRKTKYTR